MMINAIAKVAYTAGDRIMEAPAKWLTASPNRKPSHKYARIQ
jgi:hypothetical protein